MRWNAFASRHLRKATRRSPIRKIRPRLEELEDRCVPAVNILSYHGGGASTGQNLNETALTPANVNPTSFGKLFAHSVDGQVYAQPLYMSGLSIAAGTHNVVFVATQGDSVYAFDADSPGPALWQRNFLLTGERTLTPTDVGIDDITPQIGIAGTPVIDPTTGTIFFVSKATTAAPGTPASATDTVQRLHALDIATGAEKLGGPVVIQASVNGTGDGTDGQGHVPFNPLTQNQRPALLLSGGIVYIAWASHGDTGPYHGWVLGYDASSLQQVAAFNDTPNGGQAGIWQAGGALATDSQGNIYFETGNGTFLNNTPPGTFPVDASYGDSVVKLGVDPASSPASANPNGWGLKVVDFFTPFNQASLNTADVDLGSGGPVILPDSLGSAAHPHLLVAGGKEGRIYLIDRDNLGKFDSTTDHVVQETGAHTIEGILSTPALFNNTLYYVGAYVTFGKTFSISGGMLSGPTSKSPDLFSFPGSTPSISANGSNNAVVWNLDRGTSQLRAYDAASYATELYTSDLAANGRDRLGPVVKFTVPTVANGHVYVGGDGKLAVYGLLSAQTTPPAAPTGLTATVSGTQITLTWTNPPDNNDNGFQVEQSTDGTTFTQIGVTGTGVTNFFVGGLHTSTTYWFRVRAFNSAGASDYGSPVSATTSSQAPALDFSSGFAEGGAALALNGSAKPNGHRLALTDGGALNQAGSAFSTHAVDDTRFSTQFEFQVATGTSPKAQGLTFTIQATAATALGGSGAALGYGPDTVAGIPGINPSVTVAFGLDSVDGIEDDTTGLYTNGAAPISGGSLALADAGIDFHSGHPFIAAMTYDGTALAVTITDTITSRSASQAYTVDIPTVVGSATAFVGFTAGTGGLTAAQDILTWMYTPAVATPPAAPTGLTARTNGGTQVTLTWTEGSSNVADFQIDRATDGGFTQNLKTQIAPAGSTATTTFVDTALTSGSTYSYRVRATNAAGISPNSQVASVTTPVPPPTPTNGKPTQITATEIDMTWQNNANNEDGFRILRKKGTNGSYNLIATLPAAAAPPPTTESYQNPGLSPGTLYNYHIQAFNTAGYSDFTGFTVTTLALAPAGLAAPAGDGQVTLSWTAPAGAVSFNVYGSTTPGGEGNTPIAMGLTAPLLIIKGLADGTIYYYQVTAVDAGGESARSSEVSALPVHFANVAAVATALTHSAEYYADVVTAAYQRYLGRAPDAPGLAGWVAAMQHGLSDERLDAGFIGSAEYIANHGGLGQGWIQAMYHDLLGRAAEAPGQAGWLSALAQGVSPSTIAYGFAASAERETQRITAAYQTYLGRTPESPEVLNQWVKAFLSGASNENVIARFVGSAEYFLDLAKGGGTVDGWITSAYADVLHRGLGAAELAAWAAVVGRA